MPVRVLAAAAAALVACASPVLYAPAATVYDCAFAQNRRGGGLIPERLLLMVDDATAAVTVYDPLIDHYVGHPIPATKSSETAKRATYVWSVHVNDADDRDVRVDFAINYFKDGRPARMTAQPFRYVSSFSGEGTCKPGNG